MKAALSLLLVICAGLANAQSYRMEIETAFDRQKGKLYAEYAKSLRLHPGLAGEVVLEFDIAKTGEVTDCRVQSSTMSNSDLPKKLCDRVMGFKFPPRAAPTTISKPVSFYPAK